MTAFCGYFDRRDKSKDFRGRDILQEVNSRARRNLSRDPQHRLHEYSDACMFLAAFDNGAWRQNRIIPIDHSGMAWVSGNPLIPREDGVSNNPDESAQQVAMALANQGSTALFRSAGSFSAAFWSSSEKKLRLCADKLALRPLYVYLDDDSCYFASSIRVLRSLLPEELDLDDTGIAQFIYLSQNLGHKTIFKNVEVMAPGTILEIGASTISRTSYFDWNKVPARDLDLASCSRDLYRLFIAATRRRTQNCLAVDAFLTGGMDSRSVVAALLDCGLKVRAFNYSYPNSADDILGRMLAEKLGVEYLCYHSNPRDRLKINADYFALNAKAHFPRQIDEARVGARLIWSGDGGSVGLGHVYMTAENVALAEKQVGKDAISQIFKGLNQPISRLIARSLDKELRELAMGSMVEHWRSISPQQPSRRIFLYYLLNDQMRHLYHHYEQIDLGDIEFEMPFFDMDFLAFIVSLPIDLFLSHKLYNHWLSEFSARVDQTPWQAYPGHEPCPLPLPENILSQWGTDWYGGKTGAEIARTVMGSLLSDRGSSTWKYLGRKWLYALQAANALGIYRYNYETEFARKIYEEISGKLVFELPS